MTEEFSRDASPTLPPEAPRPGDTAGGLPSPSPRRQLSLFQKYATVFICLVCGALLISGGVGAYFSLRENRATLSQIQHAQAVVAASEIKQFISDIEDRILWTMPPGRAASSTSLQDRQDDYFRLLRQHPAFTELGYLSPDGREQIRISRQGINALGSQEDRSRDLVFQEAKNNRTYFGPVYFFNQSEPRMRVARADTTDPPGVTFAEVDLRSIWDLVALLEVRDPGRAYIVDAHGRLIAHPDLSFVLQARDLSAMPQVQAALARARQGLILPIDPIEARDLQGRDVLTAYQAVNPPGWFVFVEQPVEEVFAPLYGSAARTLVLLLIGVLASVLASLALARRMVTPIRRLQAGAARVGAGELDEPLDLRTGDELETLAEEFNRMAAQVRASQVGLENRVAERTEELRHAMQEIEQKSEELQAANLQLEALSATALTRYSALVESAPLGIVTVDHAGRIVLVNSELERLFGYSRNELIGQTIEILVPKRFLQAHVGHRTRHITQPDLRALTIGRDLVGRRKDGSEFPVEITLSPLQTQEGLNVTAIVRDITERQQTQETLRQRDQQLRQAQKMEALGLLAGGIAHDFNNVLTAIIGFGELLMASLDPGDARRRYLGEILQAGEGAAAMVRQLLAFTRQQQPSPRVLDVNAVVGSLGELLRRVLGDDITVVTDLDDRLGLIKADPAQIEQILLNLAINSRDAMPGGGTLTIETRNVELDDRYISQNFEVTPGDYVLLTVRDTGRGMDRETMAHIFEPFFTTKGVGHGTGLGLSTIYGIVSQSGGDIAVESEVGQGATFRLYWPQVLGAVAAEEAEVASPALSGAGVVFLVEDEPRVRALGSAVLKSLGYTVSEFGSGEDALRAAEKPGVAIDLLMTDIMMPGMDGRELADRLAEPHPHTKILYTSGYTTDPMIQQHLREGSAFLEKPFTPTTLARAVRELLGEVVLAPFQLQTAPKVAPEPAWTYRAANGNGNGHPPVRLLIVDDQSVLRVGLRSVFEAAPNFTVVGEAGSVAEAVQMARDCQPDVVILDIRLPDGSGVEACRDILAERPQTRVIMLTSYEDEEVIVGSIMAGAAGFLFKHADPQRLVAAVQAVARGESLLDPAATNAILQWMRQVAADTPADPMSSLSEQERRILPLIAEGKTNRQIAAVLYLSENTVRAYISDIFRKLHLARRSELAAFIARRRLEGTRGPEV